ncbi:DUF6912 family protein [Jannaschia sp. R86511]|uniref:DUF6912 family protein n=1 Tax=Jannaschia sp. R86511 TaxID=3093853 RepID=UPI0036D35816
MRVYLATTPARVAALRRDGVPVGTEAYAATPALAQALDLPAPGEEDADDDLAEVAVATAAEASLLLLADDAAAGADGPAPVRRVVLAADARARPLGGDAHPATVVLTAPLRFAAVDTVMADDDVVAERVGRAVASVETDHERAVRLLENTPLSWFHPSELD